MYAVHTGSSRVGDSSASASTLPFVPNYLAHPVFIHARPPTSLLSQEQRASKLRRLSPGCANSYTETSDLVVPSRTPNASSGHSVDENSSLATSLKQVASALSETVQSIQTLAQHLSSLGSCLQDCASQVQTAAVKLKESGLIEPAPNQGINVTSTLLFVDVRLVHCI